MLLLVLAIPGADVVGQRKCTIVSKKTLGGDGSEGLGSHVTRLNNGSFIIGISSHSRSGNFNLSCVKDSSFSEYYYRQYDPTGNSVQWEQCYSSSFSTFAQYGIFPTTNGEYYFFGYDSSTTCPSGLALKRERADGSLIWKKVYGGTYNSSYVLYRTMVRTADSGFVLVGASNATDGDVGSHYGHYMKEDIWALKLDSNGNKVWSKNIGGTLDDSPTSVIEAPGGGVYIGGVVRSTDHDCLGNHSTNSTGTADAYVVRLDNSGQIVWKRCLGGYKGDGAYALCADGSGGVVVAAATNSNDGDVPPTSDSSSRYWILNLDSASSIVWSWTFGSPTGYEEPSSICKAFDGSYWIAGISGSAGGEVDTAYGKGDTWVLHLNSHGNFINSRVLGSMHGSNGTSFVTPITTSNGVLVGGTFLGPGGTMPNQFYAQIGFPNCFLTQLAPTSVSIEPVEAQPMIFNVWFDGMKSLIIDCSDPRSMVKYAIFNGLGQYYSGGTLDCINNRSIIGLPELASGIYYLKLKNWNGVETTKFVLTR